MHIITHRGLDADSHHTFTESSKEAFSFFLGHGFGLEFDVRLTKDTVPVISHDESLTRLTGSTQPLIKDLTAADFLSTPLPNGNTLTLEQLIALLESNAEKNSSTHALHLKHNNQSDEELSILKPHLERAAALSCIVFDLTPTAARILKKLVPQLQLAASVAHPYDVERYNRAVGGTLLSLDEVPQYRHVYDWVWLDEWDRTDIDGEKTLYNHEVIENMRSYGYKISVVSPELHATSPHLLGGESHQDAQDITTLQNRWHETLALKPDAICTDYPFLLMNK